MITNEVGKVNISSHYTPHNIMLRCYVTKIPLNLSTLLKTIMLQKSLKILLHKATMARKCVVSNQSHPFIFSKNKRHIMVTKTVENSRLYNLIICNGKLPSPPHLINGNLMHVHRIYPCIYQISDGFNFI
jgi:hypothetical protein